MRLPTIPPVGVGTCATGHTLKREPGAHRQVVHRDTLPAVEHGHICVYCGARWFCHEDCPFAGPSACESCSVNLTPNRPRRVIPLRHSWVMNRLTEQTSERIRKLIRRDRPQ
jgi:hypothetical protein